MKLGKIRKIQKADMYYGILFYFLYMQTYKILSDILISPVLIMQWSHNIVLIILLLLILILSVFFYRLKIFIKIKIWHILFIIFLSTMMKFFNIPNKFYLGEDTSIYNLSKKTAIMDFILICRTINTLIFISIAFFKYSKNQK